MEKVRADDLCQIADRSEKKLVAAEKESAREVLLDKKKAVEACATDNAENTQPNERENSATAPLEESSAVGETTTTEAVAGPASTNSRKTPFTSLSQVDADLALARALQEQVGFADVFWLRGLSSVCRRVSTHRLFSFEDS